MIPETAKDAGRRAIRGFGMATAGRRPFPDFLVIGAKRGGTTSLYYHLLDHPQVAPLFPRADRLPKANHTKGVHYFDSNYERGTRWYRSHFPSAEVRRKATTSAGAVVVTGEASPYYLFHPGVAARAAVLLPQVRLVAILRDPVQRTYSHWKERRRNGLEPLAFEDALAAEAERLGEAEQRLARDPGYRSYAHEHLSYAGQSEYAPALQRWLDRYPRERVLVLASEDYYRDPEATMGELVAHLGLRAVPLPSTKRWNAAAGDELSAATRSRLAARFAPSNAALERLTGRTFPWQ